MTFATWRPQALYPLVPAVYRVADAGLGYPLKALLEVLEDPYRAIDADIAAMYDDWFIETCAQGLVPYIGDLVGVPHGLDPAGAIPSVRVRVADALAYARRKGPAWVLAQAAADVTGWPARAVEVFPLLSQTQAVDDVRTGVGRTADLRFPLAVEAGTPFDASYPLTHAEPRPAGPGRFTFSPFGADTPLFLPPRTAPPFGAEPGPWDVPGPLGRELLVRVLEEAGRPGDPWEEGAYPVLRLHAGPDRARGGICPLVAADLAGWDDPGEPDTAPAADPVHLRAAVDPVLGRIRFLGGASPAWVRAEWSYGFAADLGGGPYARPADRPSPGRDAFVAQVGAAGAPWPGAVAAHHLAAALALCQASAAADAVVLLADSALHAVPPGVFALAPAQRLWIVAAPGERPCLVGGLQVRGPGGAGLVLDGVLVDGTVRLAGDVDLTVRDCTLSPPVGGKARRAVAGLADFTGTVTVSRSVLGPVAVPAGAAGVTLGDSIVAGGVDAPASGKGTAVAGAGSTLTVERCTVFGPVRAHALTAADAIFVEPVWVEDRATGGLVRCFVPPGSAVPPCERCQPEKADHSMRPVFTSARYGDPAFAQLDADCPAAIRTGGSGGAEMGAFHLLDTPRRHANLRIAVDEFLPQGLEPVVAFVT
jgi:hypothetical protein